MMAGIRMSLVDLALPNALPIMPVQAEDGLGLLLELRRRKINPIPYNRWRTVPAPRQRRLPDHPLGITPVQRWMLTGRCNPIARWATPAGPIVCRINRAQRRVQPCPKE